MLIPRRVKHRKQHRPDRSGAAKGGTRVTFGEYGIQAVEHSYVTNRQIEAARIAMTRHIRRGGKVWITIYPDRPLTKKPAETRMGSGKGAPEWWVANVKPGRVMFELSGVPEPVAQGGPAPGHAQAAHEMQVREARDGGGVMAKGLAAADLRTSTEEELDLKLTEAKIELFNLRFQAATGQLESHGRLRAVRKEIARIYTVKRERELGIVVVEDEETGDE